MTERHREPLSCKERGRGEVTDAGPARHRPHPVLRSGRVSCGERPTPHPCPSPSGRGVPRALPKTGDNPPAIRRQHANPHPHKPMPHCPRPSPKGGGHPEVCHWSGDGSAPAGGVTIRSREASGHRPGGITTPVRGARWNGRRHHAFVPCPTTRRGDEPNWRLTARGGGWPTTR